jgi:carboxypeptidase Taq
MNSTLLAEVEERFAQLRDLDHLQALADWDQEVLMPAAGSEARAQALATLARVAHERAIEPGMLNCLGTLRERRAELSPEDNRKVELIWRRVRPATRIPAALAAELALAKARGVEAWRRARAESDFQAFLPALELLVTLTRRMAEATAEGQAPYDVLLDHYEPGARADQVLPLLESLASASAPLLERVRSHPAPPSTKLLRKRFPVAEQQAFVREVLGQMGFDFERGRLDLSTHPFCGGNGPHDVRLTARYQERDLRPGLFGAIHEGGHGLYEQGLSAERTRSPLGGPLSMALHESQSRLWENLVARSRGFWKHWWKPLKQRFPDATQGYKLDDIWRAVNAYEPGLIRVEADELTYNLHILLRTGLEQRLISGALAPADLPAAWNAETQRLLGLEVPSDALGCLQDIHWSMGAFGYFPTYALGNLYAAQFMEAAQSDLGDLEAAFAEGQFQPLRQWLKEKIHQHEQVHSAEELILAVTGSPLSSAAWERHMSAKLDGVYPAVAAAAEPEPEQEETPTEEFATEPVTSSEMFAAPPRSQPTSVLLDFLAETNEEAPTSLLETPPLAAEPTGLATSQELAGLDQDITEAVWASLEETLKSKHKEKGRGKHKEKRREKEKRKEQADADSQAQALPGESLSLVDVAAETGLSLAAAPASIDPLTAPQAADPEPEQGLVGLEEPSHTKEKSKRRGKSKDKAKEKDQPKDKDKDKSKNKNKFKLKSKQKRQEVAWADASPAKSVAAEKKEKKKAPKVRLKAKTGAENSPALPSTAPLKALLRAKAKAKAMSQAKVKVKAKAKVKSKAKHKGKQLLELPKAKAVKTATAKRVKHKQGPLAVLQQASKRAKKQVTRARRRPLAAGKR